MTNEERMEKYVNRNVKFFPPLLALTWDVIFIWTISTMFLSQVKGLSFSQIVTLDSILMLSGCILCIPLNKLFEKVKPILSSQIGLLGYAAYLLINIFGNQYVHFVIATIFMSIGYCINGVKVNTVLTDSLNVLKRGKDYERVYGKGISFFQIIEAAGAVVVTYIYSWNPYAAYWLSLGIVVFAEFYTLLFKDPKKFQNSNISIDSKVRKRKPRDPDGYFKILFSGFFLSLLIFIFLMRGLMSITGSALKIFMQQAIDVGAMPMSLFGLLYACYKLSSAISSKYQFKFNLKFGVRSLIIFVTFSILSFVLSGVMYLINPSSVITIIVVVTCALIQTAILNPCRIFCNNYIRVCLPNRNQDKAHSIRITVEYLGYALISSLYALLLSVFSDNLGTTNLVYIGILAIPLIISMVVFVRMLVRQYAKKNTIIKSQYSDS